MNESLCFCLNNCASVDSTNAVAEPMRAISHIQNTAPGPPMAMAVATPARLPVPTRVATLTAKAWNDEICLLWPFFSLTCSLTVLTAESVSKRNISPTIRNCTNLVRQVNQSPQPISATIRMLFHSQSLTTVIISFSSIPYFIRVKSLFIVVHPSARDPHCRLQAVAGGPHRR